MERISRSRTEAKRGVDRAQVILGVQAKQRVETIAEELRYAISSIYHIIGRFNAPGLVILADEPCAGRSLTYREDARGYLLVAAQTKTTALGLSYG